MPDLLLVSLDTVQLPPSGQDQLWTLVTEVATTMEGANGFSWDPVATTDSDASRVKSLDARWPAGSLHRLEDAHAVIQDGRHVMALNLYADEEWVAGIADWGESMAILCSEATWRTEGGRIVALADRWDLAEVDVRPTWRTP